MPRAKSDFGRSRRFPLAFANLLDKSRIDENPIDPLLTNR